MRVCVCMIQCMSASGPSFCYCICLGASIFICLNFCVFYVYLVVVTVKGAGGCFGGRGGAWLLSPPFPIFFSCPPAGTHTNTHTHFTRSVGLRDHEGAQSRFASLLCNFPRRRLFRLCGGPCCDSEASWSWQRRDAPSSSLN